jgi:hypothetical protein
MDADDRPLHPPSPFASLRAAMGKGAGGRPPLPPSRGDGAGGGGGERPASQLGGSSAQHGRGAAGGVWGGYTSDSAVGSGKMDGYAEVAVKQKFVTHVHPFGYNLKPV